MRSSAKLLFVVSTIILLLAGGESFGGDPPLPPLKEVVAGIIQAEHSVRNLEIHGFSCHMEERALATEEWKDTGVRIRGDAWFNGMRRSKARVNFTSTVRFRDGSKFLEQVGQVSWDGKRGISLREREGTPGLAADVHIALISPNIPDQLAANPRPFYVGGSGFFTNYYVPTVNGKSLSEDLATLGKQGETVTLRWDTAFGERALCLSAGDGARRSFSWWLQPERAYALRRAEIWLKFDPAKPPLTDLVEIPEMGDAGGGIWFPARATWEFQIKDGFRRYVYEAKKAVANNPAFDETIFIAAIPPHYMVQDDTTGMRFSTSDVAATTQAVDQAVQDLRGK
jgi:hypothetical protein